MEGIPKEIIDGGLEDVFDQGPRVNDLETVTETDEDVLTAEDEMSKIDNPDEELPIAA